jgi:hypothetical protein
MPFETVPPDPADLARQIERGCQLITVAILEWGIQVTRDAVAELSALARRLERRPTPRPGSTRR